jgi:hypothetical protein
MLLLWNYFWFNCKPITKIIYCFWSGVCDMYNDGFGQLKPVENLIIGIKYKSRILSWKRTKIVDPLAAIPNLIINEEKKSKGHKY